MDSDYENTVYKIFKESITNKSLPKYVFFKCSEDPLICNYIKTNESTSNRKLLRYLKKLKEQKLLSYLKHSKIMYFDKVFDQTVDINKNQEVIKKQIISLLDQADSNIFYMSDLDNIQKLLEEVIFLLTLKYVSEDNNLSKQQLMNLIGDISKTYNIKPIFDTFDDLLFLLDEWNKMNLETTEKIEDGLYRIDEVNKVLVQQESIKSSDLSYKQITFTSSVKAYIQFENTVKNFPLSDFTNEELIWFFDSFLIDNNLSIVQYNQQTINSNQDNILKYIKFDGKKIKLIDSAKSLISKNSKPQYIYCYVSKLNKNNKYNYLIITILLQPSLIEFKITLDTEEEAEEERNAEINLDKEIINILSQNTPIIIGELIETKISATFKIFGVLLDDIIFIDMLLNDDIMNTYLHLDERVTFWSEKKRLILHMKSIEYTYLNKSEEQAEETMSELIAMISQIESNKLERYKIHDSEEILKFEPGSMYLEVNIIRAISKSAIYRFYDLITKLISYYTKNKETVEKEYLKIFPNLKFSKFKEVKRTLYQKKSSKKGKVKRELLKFYAPDVFITGSPRLCQKGRQPIILENEDDVKNFTDQQFTYKDKIRNREVLRFPRDNPIYNFGCEDNKSPFIGVKKSNLSNNNIFPYIPCCFEKPQMDPDVKSAYHDYYSEAERLTNIKSKHILITDKLADFDSFGYVNRKLENLFEKYVSSSMLLRYGVVRSNNSFLHCVLTAINDTNYMSILKQDERELYVKDIKLLIFNDIHYTLGKQEMYDYTENEIYELVLSDTKFLDPKLIFRYIEEYFGINIFIFKYKRSIATNDIETKLEIPRHKLFHSRYVDPNRKSVIILKNSEKINDNLITNCELLVISKYTDINEAITIFDDSITSYMIELTKYINKTKIWGFDNSNLTLLDDNFIYLNFELSVSEKEDISYVSQFIDDNGKCFGYIIKISSGIEITIMIPPTRPFNLPLSDYDIEFPDYQEVLKIFDNPSSYSTDDNNTINGLWYENNSFFIPIKKIDKINKFFSYLSVGPKQSYFIKNLKIIETIHEKRIILSIIMNSIIKIIDITKIYDSEILFSEFIQLSNKLQDYKLDPSFFTNLSVINNINNYFETVNSIIPNLVSNNKIQIYDQKLYFDLVYFTNLYIKNNIVKFKEWKPNVMDFYKYEENFSTSNFVRVIIGENKLLSWIFFETNKKNKNIRVKLFSEDLDKHNLLLFHNLTEGIYYIVQRAKSIIQAINICKIWNTRNINTGLDMNEDEYEDINYNNYELYHINLIGDIESKTKTKSNNSSYKLLINQDIFYSLLQLPV